MDLDWAAIRRNVLPALGAAVLAGGIWFGVGPALFGGDPEPAEPVAEEPVAAEVAPAPEEPADEEPAQPTRPTILVAKEAIGTGTLLMEEHVEWREWEQPLTRLAGFMVQGAVPLQAVIGAIATRPLERGAPVVWSALLAPDHPGFISAALDPGMVAVTISVNVATNVIYPGDRVNVIMVAPQATGGTASTTIVHDARVLAVGSSVLSLAHYGRINIADGLRVDPPPLPPGGSYTLELTRHDAERIAVATHVGSLTLAVRPSIADGGREPGRAPTRLDQVMPPPPLPDVLSVRVMRGAETALPAPEQVAP